MIEMAWTEQARTAAFFQKHDYMLLGYDIAADCFTADIEGLRLRMPKQRNSFAVPRERLNSIPFCR